MELIFALAWIVTLAGCMYFHARGEDDLAAQYDLANLVCGFFLVVRAILAA